MAIVDIIREWGFVLSAALAGRMMYIARQVQHGKRTFFSVATAMDCLIAAGMGVIGNGLCSYLGITGNPAAAVIAVLGFFGTYALDISMQRALTWADAWFAKSRN